MYTLFALLPEMPAKPRTAEKAKKQTHTAGTIANLMRKTAPKGSRRAGIISTGLKLFLLRSTGAILYKRYTSEQEASAAAKKAKNGFQLTRTDERHFALNEPYDYRDVQPRRVLDYTTTAKPNGNNVDAETEAMIVLQSQMQYRMMASLINFEFSQVNTAMQKG